MRLGAVTGISVNLKSLPDVFDSGPEGEKSSDDGGVNERDISDF